MVGMIVTGHANFATGITSGLRLLAGKADFYEAVDFLPEDSVDTLTEKLESAVKRLEGCDGIIIFADLTGGSPFNVSIRLKMSGKEKIEVIGGANLPAVLNAYMGRMIGQQGVEELAKESVEAGKDAILWFSGLSDEDAEYES